MNITNLFKIALKAIGANKMRSFLTMLGIIIGVSSVIIMLALGHGSKATILQQLEDVDPAAINIQPGPDFRENDVIWTPEMMQTLTVVDYQRIVEQNKFLKVVCPVVSTTLQFVNGNNNHSGRVAGVNDGYLPLNGYIIEKGAMINESDVESSAKVCVIGKTVLGKLFDNGAEPLGAVIRIGGIPVTVIGVLKEKGSIMSFFDQDDIVLMPYTTVMKRMVSQNFFDEISVAAKNENMVDLAKEDLKTILRESHKLKEGDINDFRINSVKDNASEIDTVMGILTMLLSSIAGISLVVGGIGIMNIMYVSVTERTREIGLRMSVGARTVDIMSQFLIEAVLISVTGGLIGVLIGAGISYLARFILMNFTPYHILISVEPWTVLLSFAICTITGVFFGWYPAKKAANLDPIEALRYE